MNNLGMVLKLSAFTPDVFLFVVAYLESDLFELSAFVLYIICD